MVKTLSGKQYGVERKLTQINFLRDREAVVA